MDYDQEHILDSLQSSIGRLLTGVRKAPALTSFEASDTWEQQHLVHRQTHLGGAPDIDIALVTLQLVFDTHSIS